MLLRYIQFLSILFLLFNSCEYTPEGGNVQDIQIKEPHVILTILDTTKINAMRGLVRISYTVNLDNHEFQGIALYLNTTRVYSSSANVGYIDLQTNNYPDGVYTVQLRLITSTSSGSLADRAGGESFVFTKNYTAEIFNGAVTPSSITETVIDNGVLKVKWGRYQQRGFQKYVIQKNGVSVKTITDINGNEFSDYGYIGGYARYNIVTYVGGIAFTSDDFRASYSQTKFTSYTNSHSTSIHLNWQRSVFDSAFYSYKILRRHMCGFSHDDVLGVIYKINTTHIVDTNPIFGGDVTYQIEVISREGTTTFSRSEITTSAIGKNIAYNMSSHIEYHPATDRIYTMNNTNINIYDPVTFQLISYTHIPTWLSNLYLGSDISTNGNYFYFVTNSDSLIFWKINPSTLNREEVFHFNSFLSFNPGYLYGVCVSDNNLLVGLFGPGGSGSKLVAVNMNTRQYVATALTEYPSNNLQMTRDNRFLICGNSFYTLMNDSLMKRGAVMSNAVFLNNETQFAQIANNKLEIVRCSDMAVEKRIDIGKNLANARVAVCVQDGYIGCESGERGYIYIVNIANETIVKTIPITGGGYKFMRGGMFGNDRCISVSF